MVLRLQALSKVPDLWLNKELRAAPGGFRRRRKRRVRAPDVPFKEKGLCSGAVLVILTNRHPVIIVKVCEEHGRVVGRFTHHLTAAPSVIAEPLECDSGVTRRNEANSALIFNKSNVNKKRNNFVVGCY